MPTAHSTFTQTLADHDWTIIESRPFTSGGGPNPTYLVAQHGRVVLRLLVYAWNITGEGKGRVKTDYRVQTTRTHEGDLVTEKGWISVGLGWNEDRGVFAAFDPWVLSATSFVFGHDAGGGDGVGHD
jgi:hypothetical protein